MPSTPDEEKKYQELLAAGHKEVKMYGERDASGHLKELSEDEYKSKYMDLSKKNKIYSGEGQKLEGQQERPGKNTGEGLVYDTKIVDKNDSVLYEPRHFKKQPFKAKKSVWESNN